MAPRKNGKANVVANKVARPKPVPKARKAKNPVSSAEDAVAPGNKENVEPEPPSAPLPSIANNRPQRANKGKLMATLLRLEAQSEDSEDDEPSNHKGNPRKRPKAGNKNEDPNRNPMAPPSKKQRQNYDPKILPNDPPLRHLNPPLPVKSLAGTGTEFHSLQPDKSAQRLPPTAAQSTAPKSTAPKSTAPKSTAPKSIAPKSTAPESTAPQLAFPRLFLPSPSDEPEALPGQMSLDPELEPRVSQYRKVTRRIMLPDGLVIRVGEDIRCPPGSQILDDDDQGGVNEDDDLLQAAAENSGMEEGNEQDMGSEANIDDIYDGYDGTQPQDYDPNPWANTGSQAEMHLPVDKLSPDEDDRRAMQILHRNPPENKDNEQHDPQDVLDNHRRRNRPTQPPDEDVLQAAAKAQLRDALPSDTESSNEEDGDDEEDGDNEDNEDEDEDGPRPRAARNSKYNGIAKPTILRYYKGTWKAAIHTAKISFHKFVLFQNAFPTMEEHLVEAHDALLEVISDFKNKGRVFSQDVIHSRNMDVVVFKEAATFRGRMKTYCRSLVPRHYKDAIFPDGEWENQQGYFEKIQTNIQELLDNSTFHLAGKDEQGKTNNMMHPCIKDFCLHFYYENCGEPKKSAAYHFKDDFKAAVPEYAVALAATCVYSCLDEYRTGARDSEHFTRKRYEGIYLDILRLIGEIKENKHHKEKWNKCRREWAQAGMGLLNSNKMERVRSIRAFID